MSKIIYDVNETPFLGENGRYNYLYKIVNILNTRFYVGVHSTYNLNDGYYGSGKNIISDIKTYGIENFKKGILYFFNTKEEMYKKEKEIVNEDFLLNKNVYNIALGGQYDITRINYTLTEEHKKKISNSLLGHSLSEETKNKISKTLTGKYCGVNSPNYGRKHTEEHNEKSRLARLGKYTGTDNPFYGKTHSKENRKKMSEWHTGKIVIHNPQTLIIKQIVPEDIEYYESLGWKRGKPKKVRIVNLNTKEEQLVVEYKLNDYLNNGWIIKKVKRITIYNIETKERKRIKESKINDYLSNGWIIK